MDSDGRTSMAQVPCSLAEERDDDDGDDGTLAAYADDVVAEADSDDCTSMLQADILAEGLHLLQNKSTTHSTLGEMPWS